MTDRLEEIKKRFGYSKIYGTDQRCFYQNDDRDVLRMSADVDWLIVEAERLRAENERLTDFLKKYQSTVDKFLNGKCTDVYSQIVRDKK